MRTWPQPEWFNALPAIRGEYCLNEPLAEYTTIKVGGPAEVFARFADWDDLAAFMQGKPEGVPLTIIGKGSNMVIRDGGIGGVVAHLEKGFDKVEVCADNPTYIYAEAGAATGTVARAAREAELAGLAFFGGIPGSIGGALKMNAGAYNSETYDNLIKLWMMDEEGVMQEVEPAFVKPRYRGTDLPQGWVYRAGLWKLEPGNKEDIRQRMREINKARSTTQPLHMPSSGSWFKNVILPPHYSTEAGGLLLSSGPPLRMDSHVHLRCSISEESKIPSRSANSEEKEPEAGGRAVNAWRIVDEAGCRGWREGGAQVSEQHCNFFVNTGDATAADFDALSTRVEAEIQAKLGITMQREVRFTGEELSPQAAA